MRLQRSSSQGFTITEFLVVVAISSFLLEVSAYYFRFMIGSDLATQYRTTRDDLVATSQINAGFRAMLKESLTHPENILFAQCVNGGGCQSFVSSEYFPFTLYTSPTMVFSGPGWPSSAVPAPAWYDYNGNPCNPSQQSCKISIESAFRAQCPPLPGTITPQATCTGPAEFIQVFVKINYLGAPNLALPATIYYKRGIPIETSDLSAP